eukprot:COSAG02_NODE_1322_length_13259_cov_71.269985_9_plen_33_part_00
MPHCTVVEWLEKCLRNEISALLALPGDFGKKG